MFSLLAEITKQELEKIYELTYKYGWVVSEERQQDQLSDKAYMEKARIEGELEPLIDYGLEELKQSFNEYITNYVLDEMNAMKRLIDKGYHTNKFSTFIEYFYDNNTEPDFYMGDTERIQILDFTFDFILNNISNINVSDLARFVFVSLSNQKRLDYSKAFIIDLLNTASEDQQIDIYDELDFLEHENDSEILFSALHENEFIGWLTQLNLIDEIKDISKVTGTLTFYETVIYALDPIIYGSLLDNFKNTFSNDLLPSFDTLKINYAMTKGLEQIEQSINGSVSDKIIAFQIGLTTAHESGPMAEYLLDLDQGKGQKFLNQLSSDKYVSQWNKELQQSTGIRVGASLHLKSALILMQSFV